MSSLFRKKRKTRALCAWCERYGADQPVPVPVDGVIADLPLHPACASDLRNWQRFKQRPK